MIISLSYRTHLTLIFFFFSTHHRPPVAARNVQLTADGVWVILDKGIAKNIHTDPSDDNALVPIRWYHCVSAFVVCFYLQNIQIVWTVQLFIVLFLLCVCSCAGLLLSVLTTRLCLIICPMYVAFVLLIFAALLFVHYSNLQLHIFVCMYVCMYVCA